MSQTILAAAASRTHIQGAVLLTLMLGLIGPAAALSDPIGVWTLSVDGTTRQCRMQLRTDAEATGQAVAMPPGCHRAFPILNTVRSWSIPDGIHLAFNDEVGANVLMFGESGDGRLQALGPEGEATYMLTALTPRKPQASAPIPSPDGAEQPALPSPVPTPKPMKPQASVGAVAGHYAVMRGSRDTGCMVTLDDAGRGPQAVLKARLAPACRDQGIIVFDPVGWALRSGRLILTARKGHTTDLDQDEAGVWVKDTKSGPPLGLKRL